MKLPKRILVVLLALALIGCSPEPVPPAESAAPSEPPAVSPAETEVRTPEQTQPADPVAMLLSGMTLRQKVGQLFIIRPDSLDSELTQDQINDPYGEGVTALTDEMKVALERYPVSGIVMFSKNIESPGQVTAFLDSLQNTSVVPLFLCVDEEGGPVSRLANHRAFRLPVFESPAAVAATEDAASVRDMGRAIGSYLNEYGFNLDFAPVADVNTNPDNPVIGNRAFSSDPAIAAQMAEAMALGLEDEGIIATFKHFPGHGYTAEDSHSCLAITYRNADQMSECEWLPFLKAQADDLVMVGHIAAPEITGGLTPATMSAKMITEILKGELGFRGLVITDSLAMDAVTDTYLPGEAALDALRAGCDLLLMPDDLGPAFDAVVAAVEAGDFPEQQLDTIVERILRFKQTHGLLLHEGVG